MTRVTKRTQDIDRHVGARIRERRVMLGLSQHQLADIIGVTYQQEHKYERSINRVSAGRLFEIARGLSVPVNYFFEGFDVHCPWHNSCFDVRSGKVTNGPAKVDLKTFTIETRAGKTGIVLPRERKES